MGRTPTMPIEQLRELIEVGQLSYMDAAKVLGLTLRQVTDACSYHRIHNGRRGRPNRQNEVTIDVAALEVIMTRVKHGVTSWAYQAKLLASIATYSPRRMTPWGERLDA